MDTLALYLESIQTADTPEDLARLKTAWFGKTGTLAAALRALGQMDPEERKVRSAELNSLKDAVLQGLADKAAVLEERAWQERLAHERIDVTCPGPLGSVGRLHPVMQVMADVIAIFAAMGFSVRRGPEVELAFYNFDALNVHADHPARASQDTFYMKDHDVLLRTQTSPVQIHTLLTEPLPLRILSPGRVYRCDHDRTHTPMFHQAEGLVVEPGHTITMAHMTGTIHAFLNQFFGTDVCMRLRPSFFPFTEPSAEVDIAFTRRDGRLILGQGEDWMEVMGCGMVHPHVLQNCHITEPAQGFAFGMGLERLAMLKYGIEDIRLLYLNDQRWLDTYGTEPSALGL